MSTRPAPLPQFGPGALVVGLTIVVVSLLAYTSALDNFFFPLKDPQLLWTPERGLDPSPRFRPLYPLWNQLLLALFGSRPLGWYAVGLGVHILNALLVAFIARQISKNKIQAVVAGCAFAVFYSPYETVMWISANCGLLAMFFVLLSGAAWVFYLDAPKGQPRRRWLAYSLALLFLVGAMGFEEDCVLAGPLLVGLDLARNRWRGMLHRRSLLVYAPPIALGIGYLYFAFQPSFWADRPGVGEHAFGVGLVAELFQNLAWLFFPRAVDAEAWTTSSVWVGVALTGTMAIVGWWMRRRRPLIALGLFLALCGMLPTLPGPFIVAGSRHAYPASIGASLLIAGFFGMAWWWRHWPTWRAVAALGMASWLALNVLAIRSVEGWWFASECHRLERLVNSSGSMAGEASAVVISPAIVNAADYRLSLVVWHDVPHRELFDELVPYGPDFLSRLQPGGDLDPKGRAIFGCRQNGELFRLQSSSEALLEQWLERAADHERRGLGRTIALVHRVALDS